MPPIKTESCWRQGTIKIQVNLDDQAWETRKIPARCYGPFAIHSSLEKDKKVRALGLEWTLTHMATGLRVFALSQEKDVEKAGEWLQSKFCLVWREKTKEGITAKVPKDLVAHLLACMEKGQWSEMESKK